MMTIERHLKSEQLVDLVEYIDMMGYGEGVYKTGPAMVSLPTDQFLADEIDFKAYAPISVEVERRKILLIGKRFWIFLKP